MTNSDYQEFAAELFDGSWLFGHATAVAMEVWRCAADGSNSQRLTYFNTLLPHTMRQCCQIVAHPTAHVAWVTVQETGPMNLNTYKLTLQ